MADNAAAIYARVSTDWQAEHGYSIETQLESCRAKAAEIGAKVIKEYIDNGYSGGFLERPGLDALRDAISDGLFDVVIFHGPDRMARKLIDQLIITEEIEKAGASPVFVLEHFENSPEGMMNYQMKGVFAEYERAKIRERTMRGKRAKLRAGKAVCDSHIYGYDFDRERSVYVVNPAEAAVVKRVYELFVDERIGGCEVIAEMLNQENIPSPTRTNWCASSVRNILSRPHYTGHYFSNTTYHKKTGPKSYKRIPRPREEWIEMSCPQIIPEELYHKALEIKSHHRTYKRWKRNENIALMQGVGFCGKCGCRLRITGGGKSKRRFYECRSTQDKSVKNCGARLMEIPIADEIFWNVFEKICSDEKTLRKYIAAQSPPKSEYGIAAKKDHLRKKLDSIRSKKSAIMTWFSKSLLTQSEATERLLEIKSDEKKIAAAISALEKNDPREYEAATPDEICEAVSSCPDSIEAKRRIVLAVVDRVDVIRRDYNYGHKYILDFKIVFK